MSWIEQNRKLVEEKLVCSNRWKYFSPIVYAQHKITSPLILKNVKGNLIDIGCGRMPFRNQILQIVNSYDGLDIKPYYDDVKYVCDASDMHMINESTYDSAICLEVLEHTNQPQKVLNEIHRILKPNGVLVLTVPHLSRLHDIPNDYFRYTKFGIIYLLEQSGFEVKEVIKKGGLLTFIGHQISTIILTAVIRVPILYDIIFILNKWLITRLCLAIDEYIDKNGLFACGYAVMVVKK
jgi:SAM-dependent methyltransferase